MSGIRRIILLRDFHLLAERWEQAAWSRWCYLHCDKPKFNEYNSQMTKLWKEMEEMKKQVEAHLEQERKGSLSSTVKMML